MDLLLRVQITGDVLQELSKTKDFEISRNARLTDLQITKKKTEENLKQYQERSGRCDTATRIIAPPYKAIPKFRRFFIVIIATPLKTKLPLAKVA